MLQRVSIYAYFSSSIREMLTTLPQSKPFEKAKIDRYVQEIGGRSETCPRRVYSGLRQLEVMGEVLPSPALTHPHVDCSLPAFRALGNTLATLAKVVRGQRL